MEAKEKSAFGFAQTRLPWIVGAFALILYVITINHWARLESLPTLTRVTGIDWGPVVSAPLSFLVTYPVRWLPAGAQPIVLNLMSVVFAALTLALLARSVSLLPYDRTNDTRWLERNEHSLLSQPPAWLPPLFAVLLCGLQITFWEHATAGTGEMLDLLLFAYATRCLLEYRVGRRDMWLYKMAFVYGVAVTNNYAMIAFFPCFLIALVWTMETDFFRVQFLLRMAGFGLCGLLLYLVLPIVNVANATDPQGFWADLRTVVGNQKGMLLAFKPYVIVLLSFTSLLPLVIIGIRWSGGLGDHSAAGVAMATVILRVVYGIMLIACVSIFFDPKWSPRTLGFGYALLPFYYLAALCAGYFVGYFLLVLSGGGARPVPHQHAPPRTLKPAGAILAILCAVCAVVLAKRSLPPVLFSNGVALGQLADFLVQKLPPRPAYVIADTPGELMLAQTRLQGKGLQTEHVFANSTFLQYGAYHRQLSRRYGSRWPLNPDEESAQNMVGPQVLSALMLALSRSNEVYYLHPSFGYFFETVQSHPRGMIHLLQALPTDPPLPPRLSAGELDENQKFWETVEPVIGKLPPPRQPAPADWQWIRQLYSRALNTWGVTLQQHDRAKDATKWFELALKANPANMVAATNLAFNSQLVGVGAPKELDITKAAAEVAKIQPNLEELMMPFGPFDEPVWLYRIGTSCMQGNLFRQSLVAFERLQRLMPGNGTVGIWRRIGEVMTRFSTGDVSGAEKQALEVCRQHPNEDVALEALTQIYLMTARFTNALEWVEKQVALNAANQRALLNKAAISIHLKQFNNAIAALDALLKLDPDNSAALLNRAIAHLQNGDLDQAKRDYEAVQKVMPQYYPVLYGLGEIAYRRNDKATALEHYEKYLKLAQKDGEEYRRIAARVNELRGGK